MILFGAFWAGHRVHSLGYRIPLLTRRGTAYRSAFENEWEIPWLPDFERLRMQKLPSGECPVRMHGCAKGVLDACLGV